MENKRPLHHITAERNWMNDPNGAIYFKGLYHVFFQHHPYSDVWGPMHWGHVVSEDLIHWKHLPIALTPGDEFDKDGCFSGSAFIYENKLYVAYTGFIFDEKPEKIIQQQCLACSEDGINFKKLGLIIDKNNLPKEYAPNDFRDPYVYFDEDRYVMLVAVRKLKGKGNILKYQSKNLKEWEFVGEILLEDCKGIMIECPTYNKDLGLLIYSEQYQPVEGIKHLNIHSTFYKLGHFDKNNKFISSFGDALDYGFDFYAPQIFNKENIYIAWMDMWDRDEPSRKYGYAGSLTIPRRFEIRNNVLYQTPVLPTNVKKLEIKNNKYLEHVKDGFYKLEVEDLKELHIDIRKGKEHVTTFELDKDLFVFDRSKSGVPIKGKETDLDSLNGIRKMPYDAKKKQEIYLVLDLFSIEIFVNGLVMSNLIYPDDEDDILEIKVNGNNVNLYKYK